METICLELNSKLIATKNLNSWYSGSTGVLVLIHQTLVICANVGDSRAGLIRIDAANQPYLERLSRDHTPVEPDERERVLKAGGKIMPCSGRIPILCRFTWKPYWPNADLGAE